MDNRSNSQRDARMMTEEIERTTNVQSATSIEGAANAESAPNFGNAVQAENVANIGRVAIFSGSEAPGGVQSGLEASRRSVDGVSSGEVGKTALGVLTGAGALVGHYETVNTAERELTQDLEEVEHPEAYVGTESKLQVKERLAEDRADAQAEAGVGDPLTVKVMADSQEKLSQAVMPVVNKFINQKSFRIKDLMNAYYRWSEKARTIFGRKLGDRN